MLVPAGEGVQAHRRAALELVGEAQGGRVGPGGLQVEADPAVVGRDGVLGDPPDVPGGDAAGDHGGVLREAAAAQAAQGDGPAEPRLQDLGGGQPARQSLRRGDRLPDAVHGVRQGQQEAERLVVPPGVARAGADGAVGHSLKDRPRRAGPLPVTRGGTRGRDRPRVRAGPSWACPVSSGQTPA